MLAAMTDEIRIGRRYRAIRHRLGWRQRDLAQRSGVSQDLISLIERGRIRSITVGRLQAVAAQLDAEYVSQLRWRGGDLDRILDEAHAALVDGVTQLVRGLGWTVRPEVSYSIYGERGSIDLLAWNPRPRTLLVIEVKSELVSVEETVRKLDEKVRLARRIAREATFLPPDEIPADVGRLLVMPPTSTARRRVARHAAVLDTAFPLRGTALRRWLSAPVGSASGLLFIGPATGRSATGADGRPVRVRRTMRNARRATL